MCRLLGFRFAPRIRDLKEKRLYVLPGMTVPPELASLAAGAINLRVISEHWFELLRLALSIKTGTVTASVILRKLAAYPRQNGLALALRELGKLEPTFFTLQWLQDPELRRRSHVALNKGEQQNALRRAVFFNRLGEIRDRSYENQCHRASGLNLLVAAIILWNTTYLQRAVDHLRNQGHHPAFGDLAHLSPLGWEHINLTGDYHWDTSPTLGPDEFRPLRTHAHDFADSRLACFKVRIVSSPLEDRVGAHGMPQPPVQSPKDFPRRCQETERCIVGRQSPNGYGRHDARQ